MGKIKLTKNELKRQKDALKRFNRYLPMLQLKKRQLQLEIIKIHQAIHLLSQEMQELRNNIMRWIDVFAEPFDFTTICSVKTIATLEGNIAGIDLPLFSEVIFDEKTYDLLHTPLWIDKGLVAIKEMVVFRARIAVHHRQEEILKEELRIATQRVNLFEKVKIPEAQENIRVIRIAQGEIQTAEVVRGKIAKAKIERKKELVS